MKAFEGLSVCANSLLNHFHEWFTYLAYLALVCFTSPFSEKTQRKNILLQMMFDLLDLYFVAAWSLIDFSSISVVSAIYSKAKSIFSVVQILSYFSLTSFNLFNSQTYACGRSLILLSLTFYHRVADSTGFSYPFCGLCFSVFSW